MAVEHMRAPDLAGRAGRAGRDRDALEVEPDQRRLGPEAGDRRRRGVFGSRSARSRRRPPRPARWRAELGFGIVAQGPANWRTASVARSRAGKLGRDAEADDPGDVLGAGPVAPLLPAAADQAVADLDPVRGQRRSRRRPSGRRACAPTASEHPRRAPLMSQGIFPAAWTASRAGARRCSMHQRRRLGDRLDHAGLVVRRLERDQNAARRLPAPAARQARRGRQPPSPSTGNSLDRAPSRKRCPSSTQACSVAPTRRQRRALRRRPAAAPGVSTVFAASVPPLVKTTFLALGRRQAPRPAPAPARPPPAPRGPRHGPRTALPGSASARAIASATSGRTGAVALWSR